MLILSDVVVPQLHLMVTAIDCQRCSSAGTCTGLSVAAHVSHHPTFLTLTRCNWVGSRDEGVWSKLAYSLSWVGAIPVYDLSVVCCLPHWSIQVDW